MSRIGNRILTIPENVTVELNNHTLTVKGPKGELTLNIPSNVIVKIKDKEITVERENEQIKSKSLHGTVNALIANMLEGVSDGYQKGLEIVGVGYRFNVQGTKLVISAGYSHPVSLDVPSNLTIEGINNTEIVIKGIDKQAVGEFAANIRKVRKPEPYKGKGIRYKGEHIRRKEGKKASK
ncbi:MAG: 50S ribosomal protein L6 [Bacilli bacterium]|nr:50S ribosomal protein L6 [Bacilli bacterium]MDD3304802.1 50S ribosomal protein L6 [Bacilli bacterium]MDD4053388.1 50S ribosomal protein L6 [Bacilli bacterium]MDD4410965.1 50S ribosomal protein L6 [Bacilli bacterium]